MGVRDDYKKNTWITLPIKLQSLTIIHVILDWGYSYILNKYYQKLFDIHSHINHTWFAFTFLSDCTHVMFYISKHMKQELSEVQKLFFQERPSPTVKPATCV